MRWEDSAHRPLQPLYENRRTDRKRLLQDDGIERYGTRTAAGFLAVSAPFPARFQPEACDRTQGRTARATNRGPYKKNPAGQFSARETHLTVRLLDDSKSRHCHWLDVLFGRTASNAGYNGRTTRRRGGPAHHDARNNLGFTFVRLCGHSVASPGM